MLVKHVSFLVLFYGSFVKGRPEAAESSSIIGGTVAKDGAAPFLVSLQHKNGSHFCAGSIVDDRWVLTAGHCALRFQPDEIMVLAGTNNLDKGGRKLAIDRIIRHSRFHIPDPINDIALWRLRKRVAYDKHVKNIHFSAEHVPDNATVTLMGWGITEQNATTTPKVLRTIDLRTLEQARCRRMNRNGSTMDFGHLCTFTKKGEGVCNGDSGGALIWNGKQVGIVSFTMSECGGGSPDVFTRISYYHDWIRTTIANNSEDYDGTRRFTTEH